MTVHPSPEQILQARGAIEEHYGPGDVVPQIPRRSPGQHPAITNGGTAGFELTEDGIARAFARKHKDDLRFCHHAGKWYHWTGARWQKEETKLAFHWAREICREINARRDGKLAKASTAAAVERFAQADPTFSITSEIWDSDPFLLGTPAGTVDLRTGVLRRAARDDFITRQTAVPPDASAGCPLWMRFLEEATLGDKDLQRFLAQVAGYCLTGDVREHALFFVYGPGGNGKSVFLNVLAGVMGDYATTAAMDTFTASAMDRHPTDLAMLQGARLVSASETEEGRAWAESRIKQMTGGDTIRARFMRQDFFEYRPQFKLIIVGNHKPVLRNVDEAAKRRFNIIPFVHRPQTPDRQLEEKLRAEWPAILAWAVEGALDWQRNGLVRPAVVSDATNEYFSEQDSVRQWVEECCETGSRTLCDTTANLFASWTDYAHRNGEQPGTTKWFSQALQRHGYEPVADTPGHRKKRGFLRIRVKAKDTSGQWQNRPEAER
ncbi:MAG TPA: phage/plasmid primase, P4 family [Mesorhizobium sp.]|jgi:putative DNA primase/helicase|nr:phage/plasmid primase, P4 family [Mesorhizobium sp.]